MFRLTYFPYKSFTSMSAIGVAIISMVSCSCTLIAQQPAARASSSAAARHMPSTTQVTQAGATYEPDCNDPDAHDLNCTEPTKAIIDQAHANGYPYYIGHAEPTAEFFSTRPITGNNMQWKFQIPATEPAPAQDGSRVANFELFSAFWMGLALCDPNSKPYGACVATSDSNNPATAGAAFLELQFYPPGSPFGGCSDSQWCARLHINTMQDNNATQSMNCMEPTTEAYVTTDGTPGGPKLLMSNGDRILVSIHDTANGLQTDVKDLTTSTTGTMVASGANGFVHNSDRTTCATTAFDFHAMYATASPGQIVPWAALQPNVSFDFEIGHFELCGDSACNTKPDGGDTDDTGCRTIRGIGGCIGADKDHDGTPYLADWADGNTAAHPDTLILGSADDKGVGPLSGNNEGYNQITFQTTEPTNGTFYPFFTQAGAGTSCRFNFGNDIPGTTTNDFGKATQYGTTIANPCLPGAAADLSVTISSQLNQVAAGLAFGYIIGVSNNGPSDATNAIVTVTLPAGVTFVASEFECIPSGRTVTCALGLLPGFILRSGSSVSFMFIVAVASAGVGAPSFTTTAVVSSDQLDPNPGNNTASVTTGVFFQVSLGITKSASSNPVSAGTFFTYTINVSNASFPASFSDAPNVVVTDTLPAGVTFVSGPCSGVTVLTCNLGNIVIGTSKSFTIHLKIPADYLSSRGESTATITNTATLTTTAFNLGTHMASVNTSVIAVADLDLVMTGSPNPVHQGSIETYTMTFVNLGPSDAIQGFILDYVPKGFTFVSSSILPCGSGVGAVLCNLGPVVPAGFTLSFQIQLRVPSNLLKPGETSRNVTNEARISSHTVDPDAGTLPAFVTTTVIH